MHLYIANGTRQIQHFMYRIPEIKQVRQQTIAVGGQIKISGDLQPEQIDAIIDQHRKYGIIDVVDIEKGRSPAPLCFQVGRAISPDRITKLMLRYQGVMVERGKDSRKNAAIVMANTLGTTVREQGTGVELEEIEVSATEENKPGASNTDLHSERTIINRADRTPSGGTTTRPRLKGRTRN